MRKSDNAGVQKLLDDIYVSNRNHYDIVQELRSIVFSELSTATERVIYGGIMFTLKEDFGGIFSSTNHVSFEFSEGYKFKDPDGQLEGTGKMRRHLKIGSLSGIPDKRVSYYVKQAGEYAQ